MFHLLVIPHQRELSSKKNQLDQKPEGNLQKAFDDFECRGTWPCLFSAIPRASLQYIAVSS